MSRATSDFGTSEGESVKSIDISRTNPTRKDTRKRRDRSGTRCVAALNATQLARKRANDREAQRAIRQRTKEHIESLERRIAELSEGNDSDKELDDVRRRNYELEEEIRYLKETIALPGDDISESNTAYFASGNSSHPQRRSPSNANASLFTSSNSALASSSVVVTSFSSSDIPWSSRLQQPSVSGSPLSESSSCPSLSASYGEMPRNDVPVPMIPTGTGWMESESINAFQQTERSMSFPRRESDSCCSSCPSPRDHFLESIGNSAFTNTPPLATGLVELDAPCSFGHPSQPAWSIPLRLVPPTGPFDSILLSLIERQKSLATNGANEIVISGPHQPSMKTILYPDHPHKSHPISSVISSLLHKTALRDVPVKAAVLCLMYRFTQWQIAPSSSAYNALPDWQTPRVTQLINPHPAWVSQIIWGKLRDKVIENQDVYATEEFQYLYMRSLNVNWPFRGVDAFLSEGDEVTATDAFERHVRTSSNWSLDEAFARRYPELSEDCKFTEYSGYNLE